MQCVILESETKEETKEETKFKQIFNRTRTRFPLFMNRVGAERNWMGWWWGWWGRWWEASAVHVFESSSREIESLRQSFPVMSFKSYLMDEAEKLTGQIQGKVRGPDSRRRSKEFMSKRIPASSCSSRIKWSSTGERNSLLRHHHASQTRSSSFLPAFFALLPSFGFFVAVKTRANLEAK